MVHGEVMLLEIIKLYVDSTKEISLDISKFEKAFYTFEELIGNQLGIPVNYVFDEELEKLENMSEGLISIDDKTVSFFDSNDLKLLDNLVSSSLKDEDDSLDYCLSDYVYNIYLYNDLDITPPFDKYQDILNICLTIMQNYQLIAVQEGKTGKINLSLYALLKVFIQQYKERYASYQYDEIGEIRVVLAYLNHLYLLDGDSDFINSNWYIVLFSHDEKQKYSLNYERLFHSISNEDREYEKNEANSEDDKYCEENVGENSDELNLDELISETTYLDNETDFFIFYYTVLFNRYLKQLENGNVKNILTLKKYLLIAIQPCIEDYFFQNGTIDTYSLPKLKSEWIHDSLFTSFYLPVVECINYFNCSDSDLNSQHLADMIISAIFIKSFLDLCPNKENIEDVKIRICNSNFYKNPNYSVATSLVDDIIFRSKGMELSLRNEH